MSRPFHILIDVNRKEHSDLGKSLISNTFTITLNYFGVSMA